MPWGVGSMSGNAWTLPECEVKTLMTPDHTAFQVRSPGLDRSFEEVTGRHEKAPDRYSCSGSMNVYVYVGTSSVASLLFNDCDFVILYNVTGAQLFYWYCAHQLMHNHY